MIGSIKEELVKNVMPLIGCLEAKTNETIQEQVLMNLSTKLKRLANVTSIGFIQSIGLPFVIAMGSCGASDVEKLELGKLVERIVVDIYLRTEQLPVSMVYDAGRFTFDYDCFDNTYQIAIVDIYDLTTSNPERIINNAVLALEAWNV